MILACKSRQQDYANCSATTNKACAGHQHTRSSQPERNQEKLGSFKVYAYNKKDAKLRSASTGQVERRTARLDRSI
jgi:hypothetical protein